jgi:anti-sigma-K factor RskA
MTCDEVRELLPAYALGLLEGDELEAVEAHLRAGREHDDELVELRATSFALDLLDEEPPYSPELREQIGRIASTAATVEPISSAEHRASSRARWWLPAAAVLALLVMFGAGWAAHATFDSSDTTRGQYAYALQGTDGQYVSFMADEGSDHVSVTMAGLPRLTDGRLYRLWAIRDGEWVRIGQCNTDRQGGWVGDFAFSLQGDDQVAVTVETPSSDPQQHGTPILSSQS